MDRSGLDSLSTRVAKDLVSGATNIFREEKDRPIKWQSQMFCSFNTLKNNDSAASGGTSESRVLSQVMVT